MSGKQLLWFNSALFMPYSRPEDRLFWRNVVTGHNCAGMKPRPAGLEWHIALRRVTRMNNLLNDGTGLSRQYGDGVRLARIPANDGSLSVDIDRGRRIDASFPDLVDLRMRQALESASSVGARTIYLSYSGGSDSILIFSAMMSNPISREMIRNGSIVVLTNRHAQREDPEAWQKVLESGARLSVIDYDGLIRDDGDWMMITGDGECYGTMFVNAGSGYLPRENMCIMHWQNLARLFLDRDFTGLAWDYFRQLMSMAPFRVETVHQAWWWFEQCLDRQDDFMRFNAFSSRQDIRLDCVGHSPRIFQFFGGQDFLDHAAYNVLGDRQPPSSDRIKIRSDEYSSRWLGLDQVKNRPKYYSQDRIIRCVHKQRIFDDHSWDSVTDLEGYY